MRDEAVDPILETALHRLRDAAHPPPLDAGREAVLLAVFDRSHETRHGGSIRQIPWLATLAAAAAVLIVVAIVGPRRAARVEDAAAPSQFTIVPGAAALPSLESGSLVRLDLPVSLLPSLGVRPPAHAAATVKADLVVGQDGRARAIRLVD